MKKIFLSSILFIALISSCTKEGPQGPQGPAGNANVLSSEYLVHPNAWLTGTSSYYVNIPDDDITADIIDNGAVLVYWVGTSNGDTYIEPLPFTDDIGEGMSCFAFVGSEQVQLYNYGDSPAEDLTFKIVTMSAEMLRQHPQLRKPNVPFSAVAPYATKIQQVPVSVSKK